MSNIINHNGVNITVTTHVTDRSAPYWELAAETAPGQFADHGVHIGWDPVLARYWAAPFPNPFHLPPPFISSQAGDILEQALELCVGLRKTDNNIPAIAEMIGAIGAKLQPADVAPAPAPEPVSATKAVIYTDGACIGNPGPGGYAAIISIPGQPRREVAGNEPQTTNQRMELTAIVSSLTALLPEITDVTVHTDSKYCSDAVNQGWIRNWRRNGWVNAKRQPVANQDLMTRLWDETHRPGRTVTLSWVKGHAGVAMNEAVDRLAQEQAKLAQRNRR